MMEVVSIEGKGRGVVATKDIPRGCLLASAPVIFMPRGALNNTPLANHCWSEDGGDCLALGVQTLCNHSDDPNCVSIMHNEHDLLVSIKPIKKGAELTLNYFDFESTP